MQDFFGFTPDIWDLYALLAFAAIGGGAVGILVFLLGLPGRIAIARKHPEAEAVSMMGYFGFLAVVPWMQAFMWAFKPTDVIDIRNLPEDERRETAAMLARLTNRTRATVLATKLSSPAPDPTTTAGPPA